MTPTRQDDYILRSEVREMIEDFDFEFYEEKSNLLSELDKLPSGWILVDKESPPKDNPVFCHSIIHGAFQGLFVGGNKFQAQYLGEELNAEFWMPLPPHP